MNSKKSKRNKWVPESHGHLKDLSYEYTFFGGGGEVNIQN